MCTGTIICAMSDQTSTKTEYWTPQPSVSDISYVPLHRGLKNIIRRPRIFPAIELQEVVETDTVASYFASRYAELLRESNTPLHDQIEVLNVQDIKATSNLPQDQKHLTKHPALTLDTCTIEELEMTKPRILEKNNPRNG